MKAQQKIVLIAVLASIAVVAAYHYWPEIKAKVMPAKSGLKSVAV